MPEGTGEGSATSGAPEGGPANGSTSTSNAGEATTPPTTEPSMADILKRLQDAEAEAERWKASSRRHEGSAKANADAAKQLETLRQQNMTETERAVAEAEQRGRMAALREVGGELVKAELRATATGVLDAKAVDVLVSGLNVAAFLNEDGTVDKASVAAFVKGIAPTKESAATDPRFPDLGQGNRNTALNDQDPLLRDIKRMLNVP